MNALAALLAAGLGLTTSAAPPATAPGADVDADRFAGNACIECHRDLAGRSSEIVALEWHESVHFAAGVACDACHGGDAAVQRDAFRDAVAWKEAAHARRDPEFAFVHRPEGRFVSAVRGRSVSYFCGKCHADIKEKHLGSPHGEFGDPTCLYCHGGGSHRIVPASLAIIDERPRAEEGRCSPCHLASTMETVTRIRKLLEQTEEAIDASAGQYADLEEWGYRNLELEDLHHHAAETRSRLRQTFHSFNMREIGEFAAEIRTVADRTAVTHEMISNLRVAQRRQTIVGASVAAMLLGFAGLLVAYRHAYLEDRAAPSASAASSGDGAPSSRPS